VPDGCRGVRAVSTPRQAQAQTIQQQLDRLVAAVTEWGWTLDERQVYRDDGDSGAGLSRPGLDCLRDHAALAEVDLVVVTAPDRLARNDVHQVLLLDELGRNGCQVELLDRPMRQDPTIGCGWEIRGWWLRMSARCSPSGCAAAGRRSCGLARCWRGHAAVGRPVGPRAAPGGGRVRGARAAAVLVAQLFDGYLEPQRPGTGWPSG
jgi:site-specific DNA recombinase